MREAVEGFTAEWWVRWDEEAGMDETADGSDELFLGVADEDESDEDSGTNWETEEMPLGGG